MKTTRSALAVLVLLTSVTPALASESATQSAGDDSNSPMTEISARWDDRARDARRKQILQGLAIIGGSLAGGYLVGRAIDIGSGPRLTPWTTLAGAGVGAWLAADVISWRTFRGRASAAPTRGGARAAMAFRW